MAEPVPAARTTERVGVLCAEGYTIRQIARAAGRQDELVRLLQIGFLQQISQATADAIALAELRLHQAFTQAAPSAAGP